MYVTLRFFIEHVLKTLIRIFYLFTEFLYFFSKKFSQTLNPFSGVLYHFFYPEFLSINIFRIRA